jgi:hypothetical protein
MIHVNVIADLIIQKNLGTDPDEGEGPWPVYASVTPPEPDQVIGVGFAGRGVQGRLHRPPYVTLGHDGFQVRIRAIDEPVAREKATEIEEMFREIIRFQLAVEDKQYEIQAIHHTMKPTNIGPDPKNRVNYVLNCVTKIREVEDEDN